MMIWLSPTSKFGRSFNLSSPWADTYVVSELLQFLKQKSSSRTESNFFVLQGVLTPTAWLIFKSVFSVCSGVTDLEGYVKDTGINDLILNMVTEIPQDQVNICFADFVEQNDNKFAIEVCKLNTS